MKRLFQCVALVMLALLFLEGAQGAENSNGFSSGSVGAKLRGNKVYTLRLGAGLKGKVKVWELEKEFTSKRQVEDGENLPEGSNIFVEVPRGEVFKAIQVNGDAVERYEGFGLAFINVSSEFAKGSELVIDGALRTAQWRVLRIAQGLQGSVKVLVWENGHMNNPIAEGQAIYEGDYGLVKATEGKMFKELVIDGERKGGNTRASTFMVDDGTFELTIEGEVEAATQYTLRLGMGLKGKVTVESYEVTFEDGATVYEGDYLEIRPKKGFLFAALTIGGKRHQRAEGTDIAGYTVEQLPSGTHELTIEGAVKAAAQYTLRLGMGLKGKVTVERYGVILEDGATVCEGDRLEIRPEKGFLFAALTIGGKRDQRAEGAGRAWYTVEQLPSGTHELTIEGAVKAAAQYTLRLGAGLKGKVTVKRDGVTLQDGATVYEREDLYIRLKKGFLFTTLTIGGKRDQNAEGADYAWYTVEQLPSGTHELTIEGEVKAAAQYTLRLGVGLKGKVTVERGGVVEDGATVYEGDYLRISLKKGFVFAALTIGGEMYQRAEGENHLGYTVKQLPSGILELTIEGEVKAAAQYTLRLGAGLKGKVTVKRDGVTLQDGATVYEGDYLEIRLEKGFLFTSLTIGGKKNQHAEGADHAGYTVEQLPGGPLELTIEGEVKAAAQYTLRFGVGLKGKVTVKRDGVTLEDGATVYEGNYLEIRPEKGFLFASLTIGGKRDQRAEGADHVGYTVEQQPSGTLELTIEGEVRAAAQYTLRLGVGLKGKVKMWEAENEFASKRQVEDGGNVPEGSYILVEVPRGEVFKAIQVNGDALGSYEGFGLALVNVSKYAKGSELVIDGALRTAQRLALRIAKGLQGSVKVFVWENGHMNKPIVEGEAIYEGDYGVVKAAEGMMFTELVINGIREDEYTRASKFMLDDLPSGTHELTIDGAVEAAAQYTLRLGGGLKGKVTVESYGVTLEDGATVYERDYLVIRPKKGFLFAALTIEGERYRRAEGTDYAEYTVEQLPSGTHELTIEGEVKAAAQYTLRLGVGLKGKVTVKRYGVILEDGATVYEGDDLEIRLKRGFLFAALTIGGEKKQNAEGADYTWYKVEQLPGATHELTIEGEVKAAAQYILRLGVGLKGKVTVKRDGVTLEDGATVYEGDYLGIRLKKGFLFAALTIGGERDQSAEGADYAGYKVEQLPSGTLELTIEGEVKAAAQYTLRLGVGLKGKVTVKRDGVTLEDGATVYEGDYLGIRLKKGFLFTALTIGGKRDQSAEGADYAGYKVEQLPSGTLELTIEGEVKAAAQYTLRLGVGLKGKVTVERDEVTLQDGAKVYEGDYLKIRLKKGFLFTVLTIGGKRDQSAEGAPHAYYKVEQLPSGTLELTIEGEVKVLVAKITLDRPTLELEEGKTAVLVAKVAPTEATDKGLTWASDKPAVAEVDENGQVTAKQAGEATITATAKDGSGVQAACKVTVRGSKPTPKVLVAKITLDRTTLALEEGKTATLVATVAPADATDKGLTWASDKPAVAAVDENGQVTAKQAGEAMITAKAKDGSGVQAECKVTVTEPKPTPKVLVTKITLDRTTLELEEGKTATLVATVAPADATDKALAWASDKPAVAEVGEHGQVTAKQAGEATITATAKDGSGVQAACKVTVKAAPAPKVKVTFVLNGGKFTDASVPTTVELKKNEKVAKPSDPVKDNYTFKGWFKGNQEYNFGTPVTENITLTAKWEEVKKNAVESLLLADVQVVGNPVGAELMLRGAEAAESVKVYSLLGSCLYSQALHGESDVRIDASNWASGTYVVVVTACDGEKTIRVVKQ